MDANKTFVSIRVYSWLGDSFQGSGAVVCLVVRHRVPSRFPFCEPEIVCYDAV
jgi:hypothetical protein